MWPTRELYTLGLLAYALAAAGGLAGHSTKNTRSWIPSSLFSISLIAALLEFGASVSALFAGADLSWTLSSGIPNLSYGVRLDPLSAFFTLGLSLLAACVSIYSLGYIRRSSARGNPGLFCFFFNLLLLSLTLVFTASNVLFFLFAC